MGFLESFIREEDGGVEPIEKHILIAVIVIIVICGIVFRDEISGVVHHIVETTFVGSVLGNNPIVYGILFFVITILYIIGAILACCGMSLLSILISCLFYNFFHIYECVRKGEKIELGSPPIDITQLVAAIVFISFLWKKRHIAVCASYILAGVKIGDVYVVGFLIKIIVFIIGISIWTFLFLGLLAIVSLFNENLKLIVVDVGVLMIFGKLLWRFVNLIIGFPVMEKLLGNGIFTQLLLLLNIVNLLVIIVYMIGGFICKIFYRVTKS